jgi:hypothetical protein
VCSPADFKVAISILASLGGAAGLGGTFAIRSASSSGRVGGRAVALGARKYAEDKTTSSKLFMIGAAV